MTTLAIPACATLADLKPVPRAELSEVFPKGRTCSSGCGTILCRYNPGPWCYIHTPRYDPNQDPETARPGQWEAA